MLFVITMLATLPEVSRGQSCPGDGQGPAPDPATCEWQTTSAEADIPGTNCDVIVYYCSRECPGYDPQVWIEEVDLGPGNGDNCDGLTGQQIIDAGKLIALNDEGIILNQEKKYRHVMIA
ncbi:MAG: hypothetical protein ACHQNE_01810 [Candidatus Kapaibacterium sp.]